MGFFDLNIQYPESSPANKVTIESNRTKLAVKAMELGYTGIAYNRTMKGVMSDHNRCSISPLTLSSLLKVVPFLSLSANLHRNLLGIPLSTPFRQYTRLTVCVDNPSQAQALNSGNPILKTYDLVAVKPLSQIAFDLACERMEVDIISIDFSTKLSFRLKQPMVKAAIKRGVCFEVTYSGLVADIQIRRQLISSAKLLMDWTRGQNIVFSSGAPSVNELRGPCDVANLLSLLGLSKERAKAAISKNCRILLANSLRKKRFYKEAIRVEVLSSDASHSKEAWHQELLKWDAISSGEGDILLDDMTKTFSASGKASKTAKAIDFVSVIDSLPSHGFQVKDSLSANNAFPVFPDNKVNFLPVVEKVNQSTPVAKNLTKQCNRLDICPEKDKSSLSGAIATHRTVSCDNFFENNIHSGTTEAYNYKEIDTPTMATKLELNFFTCSDIDCAPIEVKSLDSQSNLCISGNALDTVKPHESEKLQRSSEDAKLDGRHNIDHKVEIFTPSVEITFPALVHDKHNNEKRSDVNLNAQIGKTLEALPKENLKIAEPAVLEKNTPILETSMEDEQFDKREADTVELGKGSFAKEHEALPMDDLKISNHTVLEINTSISETSMEDEQFDKQKTDTVELDEMPQQAYDEMKTEDDSTAAMHLLPDVMMEDKNFGEVRSDYYQFASVQSVSGRLRVKRRTPRGPLLLPFKRLFNPKPFKKKGKKTKSRTNYLT
ncbi:uncharacterized protein LOC133297365 [Gastrolobium bilobum]|uniref:uncharacterized protein LOC133297365 n=1 Tax=Gastrolobium bilobum TaxID=150636 RepID=UPI002AB28593|nr:uncharacterized protein LOC133297365 [Gastrolobium bilobum]